MTVVVRASVAIVAPLATVVATVAFPEVRGTPIVARGPRWVTVRRVVRTPRAPGRAAGPMPAVHAPVQDLVPKVPVPVPIAVRAGVALPVAVPRAAMVEVATEVATGPVAVAVAGTSRRWPRRPTPRSRPRRFRPSRWPRHLHHRPPRSRQRSPRPLRHRPPKTLPEVGERSRERLRSRFTGEQGRSASDARPFGRHAGRPCAGRLEVGRRPPWAATASARRCTPSRCGRRWS